MDLSQQNYQTAGFFSSGVVGFIHFQDIAMALILGFFGALGAWIFKKIIDKIDKKKDRK